MSFLSLSENSLPQDDEIAERFSLELNDTIEAVIKDPRNQKILLLRLGLFDGTSHTLKDIGDQHGISRERVRQVINSSYRRIRFSCHSRYSRNDFSHPSVILFQTIRSWIMPGNSQDTFYFACFLMRLSSFPSIRLIELISEIVFDNDDRSAKKREVAQLCERMQQVYISFSGDQKRQRKIFERMFSHTIWPKNLKKTSQAEWVKLQPKRTVNQEGDGQAGSFFSKKNNAKVEYESLLEYSFCQYLEHLGDVIKYVQQPFAIPYTTEGVNRTYYPDYCVLFSDGKTVVVEIKPRNQMGLFVNLRKWDSLQKFCSNNGHGFLIIEKTRTINHYLSRIVDQRKVDAIINAINDHDVYWDEFKKIKVEHAIEWYDFVAIVIQNDIKWTLGPFKLETISEPTYEFIANNKVLHFQSSSENNNKSNHKKKNEPYARWSVEEDELLKTRFVLENKSINEMAILHNRTLGAIEARLRKQKLIE